MNADMHGDKTMGKNTADDGGRRRTRWRVAAWGVITGLLLLVPLLAMQFTEEVNWDLLDFAVMGAFLFGTGLAYEVVAGKAGPIAYRAAVGVTLAAAFLLVWVNGAVGIIGSEANPANFMYFGVLALGIVGAGVARFEPDGMARTLFGMTLAQALVPVIALIVWPPRVASWGAAGVFGVFGLNAIFVVLFVLSALLFREAVRLGSEADAAKQ
jgi:hypothetical protein